MDLPLRLGRILTSARDRDFAVICTVLIALLLAGVGWLLTDSQQQSYDRSVRLTQDAVTRLEQEVRRPIENLDRALLKAVSGAKLEALNLLPFDMRQAALFDLAAGADNFGAMFVVDQQGQVLYDSLGPSRDLNIADGPYFNLQRANASIDLLLSGPILNKYNGRWALILSRRISRADGSFAGLAVGSVDLDMLQRMLDGLILPDGGVLCLFETNGTLLVEKTSLGFAFGRNIERAEMIRQIARQSSGVSTEFSVTDGIERVVAYRRIGSYALGIGLGLSREGFYAVWRDQLLSVGAVLIGLGYIGGALVWYLRRELISMRVASFGDLNSLLGLNCPATMAAREREDQDWRR